MRLLPVVALTVFTLAGQSHGEQPKQKSKSSTTFFERLDTDRDGKVTLGEAPEQGKMLVEFLLSRSGKKSTDQLDRAEFIRLTASHTAERPHEKAVAAAIGSGNVQSAPANCPACAMGLTAEFVFKRLDVDGDMLVTVTEFMRSPGMDDEEKARDVVGRLDKTGDGRLSWQELKSAYEARHANCKKPDPATIAADAEKAGPDGRGDGNRFAQVFILRSDQDGDGKIGKDEFRGPVWGFDRLDKNKNGFIEADELGELHQRRLNDPKSMRERLESGEIPKPPRDRRPDGLGDSAEKQ